MENKLNEEETIKNNENNIIENDKLLIKNKSEKNIIKNILNDEIDSQIQTSEENKKINRLEKSQIFQDKLKKIFLERETNKFKYNIVNIPDNLKYSSDNSNSSSPRKDVDKLDIQNKKDVKSQNKMDNFNNQNNEEIKINKEIIDNNSNNNIIKEKNINIQKEKQIEEHKEEDNIKTNTNITNNMVNTTICYNNNKNENNNDNKNDNDINNNIDNNIKDINDTKNIIIVNSLINNNNDNNNIIKNNNKEIIDGKNINIDKNNKDSKDNKNIDKDNNVINNININAVINVNGDKKNEKDMNKNIENIINNNNSVNKNNNIEDINNEENINKNNNSNNLDRNQTKNYVIKRIPERKKNKNLNKNKDDDLRNRTFSTGFINHLKKSNSKNKSNEQNISGQLNENEEKASEFNDDINVKEENEEERNKRLYRLLMAKKLSSSQNIITQNINEAINSNSNSAKKETNKEKEKEVQLDINDKNNKNQPLTLPKKDSKENTEEKKETNNNKINQEENKDNESLFKINKEKDINKNKMIKVNTSKEINAKEGALKILELIKAKKSEKNFIDQKKKETQDIIKKAKNQPVDFTESNSTIVTKEEEIIDNKNNLSNTINKTKENKEKEKICETENEKIEKKEEKENNDIQNKENKKEISKKIYKRFKGKSSLIGNNNLKLKNEFDSVINDNLKTEKFDINKEKQNEIENINNKEFINNEFKKDINNIKDNNFNNTIKINPNIYNFENNGYKTEIEDNIILKNKKYNKDNNLMLNSEEKIRREKLEKDLAAEISKDELTAREKKEKTKNISKKKFIGINRHHTSLNIANKQYIIPNSKKPVIQIKQPNNQNVNIKYNKNQSKIDNSNNLKELNLFQNQKLKDLTIYSTNQSISKNFNGSINNTKYQQIKTDQNPKKTIENYNRKNIPNNIINSNNNNNIYIKSQNKSNSININSIYAPKKCHILTKGKIRELTKSPFSPGINSNIASSKKNKSPTAFNINNEKMTYIKKNLSNISGSKKDSNHRLNNSLGNIPSSFNNNFDINKIIKNKISTEIDTLEVKNNNLNSSFQMRLNLEKGKYNTGNIFNQEDDNDEDNINFNYNLNSSYNNKYFQKNLSKSYKDNNIDNGYNTFYINNKNNIGNNYINKNLYITNTNNFNYDINYGVPNISNRNNSNNINNIYNHNKENKKIENWIKNYDNNNLYNDINTITKKNNNNSNYYQMNLYDSIKFEDLLILEDKLMNIMISLNNDKLIFNECFDYWNYFFNCSLYDNINKIFSNFDLENRNLIKIGLNYNLMSIIVSYDTSFESEKLDKIRPLLLEMLELCHKLLITLYEFILGTTNKNNNNLWIKKLYHLINSSKLSDGSDTLFIESTKITEKEKMKYNTNYLIQKIHYILYNYPSSFSQSYLMSLFKKINNKSYDDINDFFLEYILREKDTKYSILASSFLKSGEIITPRPYPYLNYPSPKNYTLILDIDETLFHFKINEDDDEQGVLKIRPGVFQFIDEIKEYYEIILFSEADKNYIDLIIDAVGDNRYLYDYVLCRDYITIVGQNFVKELSKIGRPLDKIIIIDNMPQNFSFNKENGIYIKSFWGEENDDKALIDLIPILVNIARSGKDVRKELVKYKEKIVTKISSNIFKNNKM